MAGSSAQCRHDFSISSATVAAAGEDPVLLMESPGLPGYFQSPGAVWVVVVS